MNEVIRAAAALQAACEAERWNFCFIGGLAVQRWGEPRETVDVDLTLLTGFRDEGRFAEALIARFEPRIPDPLAFALTNRVLLLRAPSGVGLDIAFGGLPFELAELFREFTDGAGIGFAGKFGAALGFALDLTLALPVYRSQLICNPPSLRKNGIVQFLEGPSLKLNLLC